MSKIALSGNASGTGTFTLASPNSNTDRTLNLPDNSGTVATSGISGVDSVPVGRGAGNVSTNTAVGASALAANEAGGNNNTAVGYESLNANTTGDFNTALGSGALDANTTASNNTAVGYQAGYSNTTGASNALFGEGAGYTQTSAAGNTFIGKRAGYSTTGQGNTFIGFDAGYSVTTGNNNTFIGPAYSGINGGVGDVMTTGSGNTIIGRFNGNQGGLDIRTANNYIVLSDGDGNPRGYFDGGGSLLFTTARTSARGLVDMPSVGGTQGVVLAISRGGDAGTMVNFYSTAATTTTIGTIGNSGNTNTTYNTSSDYRLKENIVPMTGALAAVSALNPVTWKWKSTGSDGQGFIAHELAEVVPDCVTGEKDAVDEEGNPVHQGVDTSYLIATLTAAIQEQQALITALTTRITALEQP
jgi:hypothetical protein